MPTKIAFGQLRRLAQMSKKTSNLSPQVENVPLLKESVSEAEGTAKVA